MVNMKTHIVTLSGGAQHSKESGEVDRIEPLKTQQLNCVKY